ncbi:DUF5133 domain-containing protein [Streptomyces roseolus]|uniref:DUF5133 domain-containing protein n=1 Tax=Streptomyces roseolus TaxID=67358 RepID=UPI001679CA79|nr:DUF5133 domain-containing protein [Streptomyces roseolus]GGR63818.1 DUF5133 domain-containing protein [Streptomyces roseolus]
MLMPHPAVLNDLVAQYETLLPRAEDGSAEAQRRLEDVAYTLCVSTGTRDVETALTAARRQLSGPGTGVTAENGLALAL